MRQISSLLMAFLVALLLWNNCARCTTAPAPPSSHDCCKKSGKQNCDLNAADLTKASVALEAHSEAPLADVGAVVSASQTDSAVVLAAGVEPVISPPDVSLLNSVFRI